MKAKIVIITSGYLYHFVRNALGDAQPDCEIKIVEYNNFYHAAELYRKYESEADGFLVSGKTMMAAIKKAVPEHRKPIMPFQADIVKLYHLLLDEFVRNRELDTQRVLFDFMLPVFDDATVEAFLYGDKIPQIGKKMDEWLERITFDEITVMERQLAGKITACWENGGLDMVICHYGSIIPILEAHEVPYRYVAPDKEDLLREIHALLSKIELEYMRENLPGVIAVAAFSEEGRMASSIPLREALSRITDDLALNVILQEERGNYYVFTTLKVINFITEGLRSCNVSSALKAKYGIEAYVGYGIGSNITIARKHAKEALKEALYSKECFVMDEQSNLLGPLNAGEYLEVPVEVSEEVCRIAKRCKLSTLTIQKLLFVLRMTGVNQITQQALAEHLGVTPRNAGRILGNLVRGGIASIAHTQSTTSKGRPIKVYELNIRNIR